jgi:hypothetical protein
VHRFCHQPEDNRDNRQNVHEAEHDISVHGATTRGRSSISRRGAAATCGEWHEHRAGGQLTLQTGSHRGARSPAHAP